MSLAELPQGRSHVAGGRQYPSVVGAPSSKPDRGYLPCPNPPVVCRRDGCREPATGALGLCASHLASYQAERTRVGHGPATQSPRRHRGWVA